MDRAYIDRMMKRMDEKVMRLLEQNGDAWLDHAGEDGIYQSRRPDWWTSGFWPGILWILYDVTGKERYKQAVWQRDEELGEWLRIPADEFNHDVGFQFLPTAVIKYKLTGDPDAKERGLEAANFLANRFNSAGGFIRAWDRGPDGSEVPGWAIIDCMMNIPLLFWAYRVSGEERYRHIAVRHADTVLQYAIREDGSVNHIISFDPVTGAYLGALGGQGHTKDSAWSRGTAWALYGFALAYRDTDDVRYLNAAKRVAHFFIASLPEDDVPYWDFRLPDPAGEPRDSSAGAIAASGLLEIAERVPDAEKPLYENAAKRILYSLSEQYAIWECPEVQPILTKATGNRPLNHHVNYSLIFGDYYFIEAFAKLNGWRTRIF
ncbi:glycoside hydrolase family 88 protein [Paenibacillus silviterrae]|uniref:glycoside hydrolase family 88 protein n=1 Tax=Paenibacillus silviterrae TaxID=3242194 RepID=UPI002543526D|nr:glycoside hydrolase family 88 protein [Paenibacillus chinjuensis]